MIEESLEKSPQKSPSTRSKRTTHQSLTDWRRCFDEDELKAIGLYNEISVPRGWRPVNRYSEKLHDALQVFFDTVGSFTDLTEWFTTAADERDAGDKTYNAPLGNKMIRIFWANY